MKKKHTKKAKQHSSFRESLGNKCRYSFVDGAFVEILGNLNEDYRVEFIDSATNEIIHQGEIKNNQWIRTSRIYFTKWRIKIFRKRDKALVFSHLYNCKQQAVYIAVESRSLGDTLAWFPAIEEFRVKHDCLMICSTFLNDLFQTKYPNIEFIEPGLNVSNLYAMYRIGWYYDNNGRIDYQKNVRNFREQPLAETACDILGLKYSEIRPQLKDVNMPSPISRKYVCIAVHSTAQAKYWNNETGWDEVIGFLQNKGYQAVLLSKEGMDYMGNKVRKGVIQIPEGPIEQIINYLKHAQLFIGVGSGLSWLSWAVGCQTCLISGFSYPYTEMQECIRISHNNSLCSGCFNRYKLDPSDWNWCPDHKNTPRMFECTKTITGQKVISAIRDFL
jgi:autotransporter strand-loop-strand O-heptosyltransferase